MANVFLSPLGNGFQFLTVGGLPLSGGLLATYQAGTTTPTATFTDATGTVTASNPIVLGPDGRPQNEIWLVGGQPVNFLLADSTSQTIQSYDNIYGINDLSAPINTNNAAAAIGVIFVGNVAGTPNAITGTTAQSFTGFTANGRQIFRMIPAAQNTGAANIVLTPVGASALPARNIFLNGQPLTGGELRSGIPVLLVDDGAQLNICGNGYLVQGVSSAGLSSASVINLDNTTGDYVQILGTTAITAVTLAPGRERTLEFAGSLGISSNSSIVGFVSQTTVTTMVGDTAIVRGETTGGPTRVISFSRGNGSSFLPPRGYIGGLTMSTAGSSANMSIAAGMGTDSTGTIMLPLVAAITKTTGSWSVGSGNGGLDSGTIANATWYTFFEIMRPDTGVVDIIFSTSATSPTMPANYIFKRVIGAGLTDGSAHWTLFSQAGDEFLWSASVLDVNQNNPGVSAVSRTLSVPLGRKVWAIVNWEMSNAAAGVTPAGYISSPDQSDETPSLTAAPLFNIGGNIQTASGASNQGWGQLITRTNTSAQVRTRLSASDGNTTLRGATIGWRDRRGQDD